MIHKSTVEISSLRKHNSIWACLRMWEKSFLFMLLLLPLAGCLINNGEKEISLRRSQQQRNYLMNHHESATQGNQNRRRQIGQQSISRDQQHNEHVSVGGNHAFSSNSNRMSRLASKNSGTFIHKKNRKSFRGRENARQKSTSFKIPECDPDTGCVNVTKVFATLGRTASMNCLAKDLVGQKTVSWVRHRDVSLIAVGKFVYTSDKRFRVLHESNANDWILTIKSVTYKDQGIYECQVTSEPYTSFKYILKVVEPRTEIVGKKELYVDYASSLNITCLIKSPNPPAYVFWKKEGKVEYITNFPKNYTYKVKGSSRRDRWNDDNIDPSHKPTKLARKVNTGHFDASDITSLTTRRSTSLFHTPTERPYMSNISYVVIPSKGSVRVLYKKHWKPGVTVSSLLIDRVNYTHSGIFWCMPSNSANKSVHVHVLKDDSKPAAIHTTHQESSSESQSQFIHFNTFKTAGITLLINFFSHLVFVGDGVFR